MFHNRTQMSFFFHTGDLSSPDRWLLFDRILQQLVTQESDGSDREVSVVDINVKDIVQL